MIVSITSSIAGTFTEKDSKTNRGDSLYQPVQISFLPFLSTSGPLSSVTTCNVSINILAGMSGNVNGAQFGSLVNYVGNNAGNIQLAGLGNITGNKFTGFQCAGLFNLSEKLKGVQLSGILGLTSDADGAQISGIANFARSGRICQISGIANYVRDTANVQLSGLFSQSAIVRSCQISGLMNNACVTRVQIAGLVNNAGASSSRNIPSGASGLQLSGIVNIAGKTNGMQAALVNIARSVHGVQIGLVNIADSCHGTPIGVINIYKNGYHVLELSENELFFTNVAYRSGMERLHGIVTAGIRPDNFGSPIWNYGGGLGSLVSLSEKNRLGFDVMFLHVVKSDNVADNYLSQAGCGIDHKITSKTSIYLGLTANLLSLTRKHSEYTETYQNIAPYHLIQYKIQNTDNKAWLGAKLALRFF